MMSIKKFFAVALIASVLLSAVSAEEAAEEPKSQSGGLASKIISGIKRAGESVYSRIQPYLGGAKQGSEEAAAPAEEQASEESAPAEEEQASEESAPAEEQATEEAAPAEEQAAEESKTEEAAPAEESKAEEPKEEKSE